MEEPTADAILAAVSTAYRAFIEYEDSGLVSGGAVASIRFETRFRRGSVFRFSYVALLKDGRKFHDGEIALDAVQFAFKCSLPAPQPTSLKLGVAALTGISGGAAHGVPSLLIPEVLGGWLPTSMRSARRLPDTVVRGRACFQVAGQHPTQPSMQTLVIDKGSYLIQQRIQDPELTDYESCRGA